jgi:putative PIN family toxin of toxin-antitoxin system
LRAVVDTNIFVSSLISPAGPPAQVLVAFEERRFTLISSKPLLQELETVLGRAKFHRRGITPERTRTL